MAISQYTPTNWAPGDPITPAKMNKIEEWLLLISQSLSSDETTLSTLGTLVGSRSVLNNITAIQSEQRENIVTAIAAIAAMARESKNTADTTAEQVTQGLIAATAVQEFLQTGSEEVVWTATRISPSIGTRVNALITEALGDIPLTVDNLSTTVGLIQNEVNGAHRSNISNDSLTKRFQALETQVDTNKENLATLSGSFNSLLSDAKGEAYDSLAARLNAIDNQQDLTGKSLPTIADEVIAARRESASVVYQNLKARLDNMDTKVTTAQDTANAAVPKSSIVSNLNSNSADLVLSAQAGTIIKNQIAQAESSAIDTAAASAADLYVPLTTVENRLNYATNDRHVLGAYQGKVLKDAIDAAQNEINAAHMSEPVVNTLDERFDNIDGGTIPDRTLPSVIDEIEEAHRTTDDTLDDRFIELEDAIHGDGGLDERLTDAESAIVDIQTEISTAHDSTVKDSAYNSLDDRFEAIETDIESIASDVSTIATELNMYDINDTIVATNSRIDTIEENVVNIGKEIGMLQDEAAVVDLSTQVSRTNTRIDSIEERVDAIDGAQGALSALDSRVTTNEGDIDALEGRASAAESAIESLQGRTTALETTIDTPTTGLTARVGALESEVAAGRDTHASLDSRFDNIEGGLYNLTTAIDNTSNTVVLASSLVNFDTDNKTPTTLKSGTIDDQDDYLIQDPTDDKYYYWKHINNEWHLMGGAGGGGTGTSSAVFAATLPSAQEADLNTDYYIGTPATGYTHYRFNTVYDEAFGIDVTSAYVIGQSVDKEKIKRYNIATEPGQVDGEDVTYLNLYQFDYDAPSIDELDETNILTRVILPRGGAGGAIGGNINKLVRFGDQTIQKTVGSQILLRVFYSSYDSEGIQSNAGTYTLTSNNTVIDTDTISSGAIDADLTQGFQPGVTGYVEFDVTEYCKVGPATPFTLTVQINENERPLTKTWTVNLIDLRIESEAPQVLLINSTESYNFPYTAFGALNKTLHVIIDGDTENESLIQLSSLTSGRPGEFIIPPKSHGVHSIEMYLTAIVGGAQQDGKGRIIREYIWYDDEVGTTLLASPFSGQTITAQQYSTIEIPYQVYKKDATEINVTYYVDGAEYGSAQLQDANTGLFTYLADSQGDHTLTIEVDGLTITTALNITKLDINVAPISGAIIDFDPTTLTNSSTHRFPTWTVGNNSYTFTASPNFNWSEDRSGGGYKMEDDGKAFVIKAGSYVDLNYPMFAGNGNSNVLTNGAEMKIIFKTDAVRNIDAIWYQNIGTLMNKPVGLQLSTHSGWLKTDKATDENKQTEGTEYEKWESGTPYAVNAVVVYKDTIYKCVVEVTEEPELSTNPKDATDNWISMGKIETEVLSTNSYLYFPYSERDKIELDININKYNANADTNFIMSYEDGVPSKAYAYDAGVAGDGLYHSNTIRIGSPDCDVYIYRLRIYNRALSTADILQNFIADGNGINEKVSRHTRNSIYWDPTQNEGRGAYFTSPSVTATLDPIKLAEILPDVKILMLDTPVFTIGKKNFVANSTLRCIHTEGGEIYPSRGDLDNWFFTNGFHAGQGTTSDNYGQSARNVDFLFEADGVNYPTKKKNMSGYTPDPQKRSTVYVGKNASEWNGTTWTPTRAPQTIEVCDDWKGDNCKISLTSSSVPNNYFNLKVNVASSENVNNALFQKRYDDFLVYNAPSQTKQILKHRQAYAALGSNPNEIKVKNSMEFVPAILFVRENEQDLTKHTEFQDTNWHFYALGNIGDSKKTDYTRAYDPDDMNEFTCENSDNNTNNGQFQSGVFMYYGRRAIETPYKAYESDKTYENGAITIHDGVIKVYNDGTWSNVALEGWTDNTTPYFAPYSAPNPMEYIYPITSSEWNVRIYDANADTGVYSNKMAYANYKHHTLVTEEFDGDHSFEFRYACRGDYRDGDLINKSAGQDDDAQFDINHDVVLAFYEWLITSTEEQYRTEAPQWFVKSAMEFFYAYTHYYTMMDNRAKNTFWHFAKTGEHIAVSRPVQAMLHTYTELINGEHQPTSDTTIQPNKTYYTEYAFDLWSYDMDRRLSI